MYNEVTKECTCNRCGYSWRSRGDAPKVCPKCTSAKWQDSTRKFSVIISRFVGIEENGDRKKFCIIPYMDRFDTDITDDIFYLSKEDEERYLVNRRYSGAMIWIGSLEIGEDQELKINEIKLIYCHDVGFRAYTSSVRCLYNIRSFYEKVRADKIKAAEAERLAILEEERKQRLLEAAKQKIEEEAERLKAIEAAKRTIANADSSMEEKMKAVALLRQT